MGLVAGQLEMLGGLQVEKEVPVMVYYHLVATKQLHLQDTLLHTPHGLEYF